MENKMGQHFLFWNRNNKSLRWWLKAISCFTHWCLSKTVEPNLKRCKRRLKSQGNVLSKDIQNEDFNKLWTALKFLAPRNPSNNI